MERCLDTAARWAKVLDTLALNLQVEVVHAYRADGQRRDRRGAVAKYSAPRPPSSEAMTDRLRLARDRSKQDCLSVVCGVS